MPVAVYDIELLSKDLLELCEAGQAVFLTDTNRLTVETQCFRKRLSFHCIDGLLNPQDIGHILQSECIHIHARGGKASFVIGIHCGKTDRTTAILMDDRIGGGHSGSRKHIDPLPTLANDLFVGDHIGSVLAEIGHPKKAAKYEIQSRTNKDRAKEVKEEGRTIPDGRNRPEHSKTTPQDAKRDHKKIARRKEIALGRLSFPQDTLNRRNIALAKAVIILIHHAHILFSFRMMQKVGNHRILLSDQSSDAHFQAV
ncbi:MAG: hypothetical protein E7464_06510 [Ruminococcaceae bacterium]|nr:hypothetical protein [Oscillospiraceae bacterium]